MTNIIMHFIIAAVCFFVVYVAICYRFKYNDGFLTAADIVNKCTHQWVRKSQLISSVVHFFKCGRYFSFLRCFMMLNCYFMDFIHWIFIDEILCEIS